MASTKNLTVNFFRAEFDGEKRTESLVHDLLVRIIKRKFKQRVKFSGSEPLLLGEYSKIEDGNDGHGRWVGQLRRIRPYDRIAEGNTDGYFADAPFKQGHATETGHFMVIPAYRALLYAGSPFECGWTQLRHYLQAFSDDTPLHMYAVLNKDKVKQLERMGAPKKFVMKVSRPEKWLLADSAFRDTTRPGIAYGADWIRIEVGMNRGRGRKLKDAIRAFATRMSAVAHSSESFYNDAHKLQLEGYTDGKDGAEKVEIDFIEDRVQFLGCVDMSRVKTVGAWTNEAYKILRVAHDAQGKHIRAGYRLVG